MIVVRFQGKRSGATRSWAKPAAGSRRGELRGRVPMLVAANLRAGEIDRPAGDWSVSCLS